MNEENDVEEIDYDGEDGPGHDEKNREEVEGIEEMQRLTVKEGTQEHEDPQSKKDEMSVEPGEKTEVIKESEYPTGRWKIL